MKSELEKLIDKWESEKGSYIPNVPIFQAFIDDAKAALKKEKEADVSTLQQDVQKKCKFNKGELVYFTLQGIKDGQLMVASIPKKYFELDVAYVIQDIGLYGNSKSGDCNWHILVDGSSQFVNEKYFSKAQPEVKEPTEKRKYEIITIDGSEFYLIPKEK